MTPTKQKILVGAIGYFGTFGTNVITYLTGIRDNGGTWHDVDSISIALFALIGIVGGAGALGALLATSPQKSTEKADTE